MKFWTEDGRDVVAAEVTVARTAVNSWSLCVSDGVSDMKRHRFMTVNMSIAELRALVDALLSVSESEPVDPQVKFSVSL